MQAGHRRAAAARFPHPAEDVKHPKQLLIRADQGGRQQRRRAVGRMGAGGARKRFSGAVHKVMPPAAVNVDVDKSGGNILPTGVKDGADDLVRVVAAGVGNDTVPHNQHPAVQLPHRGQQPAAGYGKPPHCRALFPSAAR